jgi:hypothetical protein
VEREEAVTEALTELGLQRRPFMLENEGVQVMRAAPWARVHMPDSIPLTMDGVQVEVGLRTGQA